MFSDPNVLPVRGTVTPIASAVIAMAIASNGRQEDIRRMWPLQNVAVLLFNWANIGLIISAVVLVVSTILVVWMGNVKEEYLHRDLQQSRERTAAIEKQSAIEA